MTTRTSSAVIGLIAMLLGAHGLNIGSVTDGCGSEYKCCKNHQRGTESVCVAYPSIRHNWNWLDVVRSDPPKRYACSLFFLPRERFTKGKWRKSNDCTPTSEHYSRSSSQTFYSKHDADKKFHTVVDMIQNDQREHDQHEHEAERTLYRDPNDVVYFNKYGSTIAFSANDTRALSVTVSDEQRNVHVWNLADGANILAINVGGVVNSAVFWPESNDVFLAIEGMPTNRMTTWRVMPNGKPFNLWEFSLAAKHPNGASSAVFIETPQGRPRRLLTLPVPGENAYLWYMKDHRGKAKVELRVQSLGQFDSAVLSVACSPDKNLVFLASLLDSLTIQVRAFGLADGVEQPGKEIKLNWGSRVAYPAVGFNDDLMGSVELTKDGRRVLIAGRAHILNDERSGATARPIGYAAIWDIETGELLKEAYTRDILSSAAISPDAQHVVMVQGKRVAVWNLETNRIKGSWEADVMFGVVFSQDGRRFLTDGVPKVWRL